MKVGWGLGGLYYSYILWRARLRAHALYSMVDGFRQGIFWLVGKKKIKYAGSFMSEERKK